MLLLLLLLLNCLKNSTRPQSNASAPVSSSPSFGSFLNCRARCSIFAHCKPLHNSFINRWTNRFYDIPYVKKSSITCRSISQRVCVPVTVASGAPSVVVLVLAVAATAAVVVAAFVNEEPPVPLNTKDIVSGVKIGGESLCLSILDNISLADYCPSIRPTTAVCAEELLIL
ncbi:hypothetical protein BDB00DRAFT_846117 [Zychaea mexicana]|uniref:uncharacterized protein n=1 Tax=Zychaea mexicana TaxID=64656 RepID=UPI0022FE1259|nr:uncharacterized protein BDB00DRAFT_846117 [Zychaea mexicana]KAI9488889.1 hypothetical protein BDB00DRAFT_846117 [Zychaea mexicana]